MGPALDAFESLASGKGPEYNDSYASKVLALGADFRCIRFIGIGPGSESDASNASQVLALGADFRCIRFISIGPVSESNASNESEVLAFGPILDSCNSMSCHSSHQIQRLRWGLGEPASKVSGGGNFRVNGLIRFGPGSEHLMHLLNLTVPPGL